MSEVRELTNKELDAVCGGGGFRLSDSFNYVQQQNNATQVAAAVGGPGLFFSGNATARNWLNQANVSII
jgi:hypothetical protein